MRYEPADYQRRLADFLASQDRAAGFASPGLGKTAATLDAFHQLMVDGAVRAMLVVAPLRVATLTWPNEIAKWDFSRTWKVENLRDQKPSGRAQVYLINYESVHKLKDLSFCDVVVFDELTKAKNHKSKRIKYLTGLFRHHRRIGLTGTPRPNSLLELFAQIRLLDDGQALGRSFEQFKRTYCYPTDYMEYNWVPKPGAEQQVYDRIAHLALTLRASDYLDIPDTEVEDVEIALPEEAQDQYRELEKHLVLLLDKGDIMASNAGVLVSKLLQVTGGQVYDDQRQVIPIHGAKIAALKKVLTGLDRERAILFTNFIHERERVVREIPGAVDAARFDGDIEEAWNRGRIQYLVADPRSLGHGLNLQAGGRNTIWYSLNHSRELYDQANARTARKGQTQTPRIYRILCSGTIDDAVVETLRNRGDEQNTMLAILSNYRKLLH